MNKAALLGCGIVGGGVATIMHENAEYLEKSVGERVELKYILEKRDCSGEPWADRVVTDFSLIENDPEVSVVAECIGGVGVAYEFVKRALQAGKSVVTCNKQMIAERGLELLRIAKEKGVFLLFEASVGGGIPLIRPLTNCLSANRIEEVCGIVNGTTNYILTQMIQCGESFENALAEAQKLGYAEADPAPTWTASTPCARSASWPTSASAATSRRKRSPPRASGASPPWTRCWRKNWAMP